MNSFKTILVSIVDNLARVTINRPEALNALNQTVLEELQAAFEHLNQAGVLGILITGAGEKAFVAGADIAQMQNMKPADAAAFCRLGHSCMSAIQNFKSPVIAAVNGFALGGGLELALSCDFIYASKNAKLGLPEVNLGIFPGFGGTQRLPRLVGRARAKEIIFTADMMSADEAFAMGLVNKVFETSELLPATEKSLKKILSKGPLAIEAAKRAVNLGADLPLNQGLEIELQEFPQIFSSADSQIGILAFLSKEKPQFTGK